MLQGLRCLCMLYKWADTKRLELIFIFIWKVTFAVSIIGEGWGARKVREKMTVHIAGVPSLLFHSPLVFLPHFTHSPPPHPLLNQVCYAGFLKVLFDFSLVSRMFFPRSFLVMIILTVHQNFSFTQVLLLLLFNCLSGSSW